ncbi:two component, sigma54 specific, transcriptional regulator, Fis family [Desulfobulbus propionicus DSM 2032]|jgi:two-component system response regulator PilR (NtrC family)|uniref:Two component, sigma54 specific, transcriptional regulator, Fis family n=2 Tax=Desulfobulbus propionicus TaxID=894 RepID=A0A7U4DQ04_DESPD|nr:sigma-54 dependent transcriptional regulator [Desulfobulbus propionicus]ADW18609.1 two component, sigma54 specific, transcriptional regulator, Fis family [Desulfobulbus propionicus DSM 2032]
MNMASILVVDDELSMREFLKILLEKEGYQVATAADGQAALERAEKTAFDLVITDIRMPGMSGLDLLARLKQLQADIGVIMITAFASPDDAVTAMKSGAFDYITKPFNVDEIKTVIRAVLKKRPQVESKACSGFPEIIGQSPEMMKIFDLITKIAPTPANVLIYGESGTGKELVAKAIHNRSRVANNPFVPITCSAIPESLLESELFGHVKGSFTGAIADKAGLFQQADGGTAFLDEIGELTPIIQTKLLRVLQEREFMPVGSTKTRQVNVRIIAATNRILEQEIISGKFREDLYYRLAVVPIRVPPLRERRGDVPLLVDHFLKKYSTLLGKEIQTISSYGMEVLMQYDFPGNVRELENIIERGVALESSNIILPESLILSLHRQEKNKPKTEGVPPPLFVAAHNEEELFAQGLEEILQRVEKEMILHALAKADNSKMRAADLLKLSFRSLRYKTKKHGID